MASIPIEKVDVKYRPNNGKVYFTYSDLLRFKEFPEGPLLELQQGELYVVPSPNTEHQDINSELNMQIRAFIKNKKIGKVFTAPYDVIFSDENTTIPDIVFVSVERYSIITKNNIQGNPNFIIEITSQNRKRDFVEKKEIYETFNVPEYWIVDTKGKKVLVYLFKDGKYGNPNEYTFSDEIPVSMISNLVIDLSEFI